MEVLADVCGRLGAGLDRDILDGKVRARGISRAVDVEDRVLLVVRSRARDARDGHVADR